MEKNLKKNIYVCLCVGITEPFCATLETNSFANQLHSEK